MTVSELLAPSPTRASIETRVCKIVAESLAIDPARVSPASCLIDDLGAESLDFLDIVFKIERQYDIQITRGELERAARGDMSDEEFAPSGVISAAGLQRLRDLMPEASDRIQEGLRPAQIIGLFSVSTFIHMVERKLALPE